MHNYDLISEEPTWPELISWLLSPSSCIVEAGAEGRSILEVRESIAGQEGLSREPRGSLWGWEVEGLPPARGWGPHPERDRGVRRLCRLLDRNCWAESSTWILAGFRQSSSGGGLREGSMPLLSWTSTRSLGRQSRCRAVAAVRRSEAAGPFLGCRHRDSQAQVHLSHDSQPHRGHPGLQRDHADPRCFPSFLHWNGNFHGSGGSRGVGLLLLLL